MQDRTLNLQVHLPSLAKSGDRCFLCIFRASSSLRDTAIQSRTFQHIRERDGGCCGQMAAMHEPRCTGIPSDRKQLSMTTEDRAIPSETRDRREWRSPGFAARFSLFGA